MEQANQKNKVLETYCLLIVDVLCIILSLFVANMIRHKTLSLGGKDSAYTITLFCLILCCVLYSTFMDYSRDFIKRGFYVEFLAITKMNMGLVIVATFSLFFMKASDDFSRLVLFYFAVVNECILYVFHWILKKYLRLYLQKHRSKSKVMVVIEQEYADKMLQKLLENTEYMYEMSAAVVWDADYTGRTIQEIPVVASRDNLMEVARQIALDEVFLYIPNEKKKEIEKLIHDFEEMGIICHYNIDVAGIDVKSRHVGEFAGYTVVTYAASAIDYKHHLAKRCMDIAGGLIGLLITTLFFPFVALAIKAESKGPVLFSQIRIGKNGRRFKIYKFRSMYLDAEERKKELEAQNEVAGLMFKMEDDPRVTKVGRFLRKTSIDELPQFYNVLKGDMSLVGTRPPTVDEFEQYNLYYRRRLCMTPGLTGLWQVSGRSEVDNFDDVVKYDLHYIDYWSLSLDVKILFRTIAVVLFGKGAK